MYVVYPILAFNAAISLYILKRLVEWVLNRLAVASAAVMDKLSSTSTTTTPSHSSTSLASTGSSLFTTLFLVLFTLISLSRTASLYMNYSAPFEVYGLLRQHGTNSISHSLLEKVYPNTTTIATDSSPMQKKMKDLNLCVGKEWYRFPSHYFIPEGIRLRYLKSQFSGLLPKYYYEPTDITTASQLEGGKEEEYSFSSWSAAVMGFVTRYVLKRDASDHHGDDSWRRGGTYRIPASMNDVNREEMDRYVSCYWRL